MDTASEAKRTDPHGGGFMGFIRGTQSLAAAFWGIGVMPALVLYAAFFAAAGSEHFLAYIIALTAATMIVRVFAWYAIIKCRKNTSNEVYTVLAMIVVGLDIVHKLFVWSVFLIIGIPKLMGSS